MSMIVACFCGTTFTATPYLARCPKCGLSVPPPLLDRFGPTRERGG